MNREVASLVSGILIPLLLFALEIPLYLWFRNRFFNRFRNRIQHKSQNRFRDSLRNRLRKPFRNPFRDRLKSPDENASRVGKLLLIPFILFGAAPLLGGVLRISPWDLPGWLIVGWFYPVLLWHSSLLLFGFGVVIWKGGRLLVRLVGKGFALFPPVRLRAAAIMVHPGYLQFDASRRVFLRRGALGMAGMTMAGTAYGMLIGRNGFEITTTEIAIPNLPPEFDRFVIGLVSDIHSGIYMLPGQMNEYVRAVNDLGADLIAVPGDFVNGRVEEVYPFADSFGHLRAPHGVFGVLGNHDFYSGDPDAVASEIGKSGMQILRDTSVSITRGGARIRIAGVDDVGRNDRAMVRLDKALPAGTEQVPTILLCHRPYYLEQAAAKNVSLVLSGHTHGGQIVFGRFGNSLLTPAAFVSTYVWGKYAHGQTQMYITRGLGTVGVPVRINCPPEISRIVLRRA